MSAQRVIGLIGGMSWESSAVYYRIINQATQAQLGGLASARCLMWSFDFAEIEALQVGERWEEAGRLIAEAARRLQDGGARICLICTNTMHMVADQVEAAISIPLLHIADPTGDEIRARGLQCVGLLGTAFTMERDFYRARLSARFGLEVLTPEANDRALVHRIIYEDLVRGIIKPSSRQILRGVIARLRARGAQGVILGCTELMLLMEEEDAEAPLFDTTELHARAAVDWSLGAATA
jgi:aspartate racemase